ncbi:L-threonylcarbamoyladenylate synthase [Marinobacter sp. X15-166B]|uniref:L-threonylcarbamoyladenylate synthase n=1 Tax=Marinobacter sp. X15-166B TaxID=1897620 RepID=UPI00085CC526|nr:Sua5/YciO/YrdC/YwlC family protein [Marinobacter sp. X15-166B]OEY66148.1 tRNA threonylcarbamoyladenosine biosynthesis protein RimN [Marinobacter sp. X15-166B]
MIANPATRPGPLSDCQRLYVRRLLAQGGVIAYPTEAVWGLGCDPWNEMAVDRILSLKQRAREKGLILAAASVEQIGFLLEPLAPELRQRALDCWPGPVTCLLPDVAGQIPEWVKGAHTSVAVRVSQHPVVCALSSAAGQPLVSTSCNPATRPPARTRWQVARYFGGRIDWLAPGNVGSERQPSQIIDIATGRRLR